MPTSNIAVITTAQIFPNSNFKAGGLTSNINVASSSLDKNAGFQLTVDSLGDGDSKSEKRILLVSPGKLATEITHKLSYCLPQSWDTRALVSVNGLSLGGALR